MTGRDATMDLKGIFQEFAGPPPTTGLHPTDLAICEGDYVAVVGPSGSGKTTLFNLLALLNRPTGGHYRFEGIDTGDLTEDQRASIRGRRMGIVFQAFHLLPFRSAWENVALAQMYVGDSRRHRAKFAKEALSRLGLAHRLDALPRTMSAGEQQRTAVARAIVNNPAILLCDEPTGNLDSRNTDAFLDIVGKLHEDGLTVFMITHNQEVAERAERLLVIRDGRVSEPRTQQT